MSPTRIDTALERQGRIATIAVVTIGYVVNLVGVIFGASLPYTPLVAVFAILLGAIYVALLLRSDEIFARFPSGRAKAGYFSLQSVLVFTIQAVMLGPGTWLIPLPLVGLGVERLSPRWRWPLYLATILGMTIPLGVRTGDWVNALNVPLLLIPAVIFVVVLTQAHLAERQARREAERLSERLEEAHSQLSAYAMQAEELAITKERNRLAREIHDDLGHYLTVTNVQLEAARAVMERDPEKALDALGKAQQSTHEGLTAVRESVAALRESPIGDRPLIASLEELLAEVHSSGIVTELDVKGERRKLSANVKITLYRILQEGLTNVRKHARASRVDVVLDYREVDSVQLIVNDNGIGTATTNNGFGFIGMRERVRLLNGDFQVRSAPGKGFTLEVTIPDRRLKDLA